jgi:hypothetical protein
LLLHFSVQRKCRYFGSFESLSKVHFTTGLEFGISSRKFLVELTELPVMVGLAFDFFDRSIQIFGLEFGSASFKMLCLLMFVLIMCEDRISLQPGPSEFIRGFTQLPDQDQECAWVGC